MHNMFGRLCVYGRRFLLTEERCCDRMSLQTKTLLRTQFRFGRMFKTLYIFELNLILVYKECRNLLKRGII